MDKNVKKVGSTLGKFGSAAAGLAVGSFVMKKIPPVGPPIVQKTLPGLAGMTIAYLVGMKADNEYVKSGALGLGLAGFADVVKKTIGPRLPAALNDAIPSLSGMGVMPAMRSLNAMPTMRSLNGLGVPGYAAVNQGDFPPSYYKENAFQGLGNTAYKLEGRMGNTAYDLEGPYDLEGFGRALTGN